MRIVMIHPPVLVHRAYIDYPLFTGLGVWTAAAALGANGHAVRVVDAYTLGEGAQPEQDDYFRLGANSAAVIEAACREPFDVAIVHLSPFAVQQPDPSPLSDILAGLREQKPNGEIILADLHIGGMNYVAYDDSRFLSGLHRPDWLLRYEGERSLLKLIHNIETRRADFPRGRPINGEPVDGPLGSCNGGLYRYADLPGYARFLRRELARQSRPPAFELDAHTLPFKSSRGCCFSCSFCTSNPGSAVGYKREWRPMAAEQLELQLGWLVRNSGTQRLWILDEAANVGAQHFDGLLSGLERHNLRAEFPNGLRADRVSDDQIWRLAGRISLLSLSPESGSPRVLETLVGKRQSLGEVERVAAVAQKAGLPVALHFIVGLPGERKEDIHATFTLARRLFDDYGALPWVQFAVALPNTPLYRLCQKNGLLPDVPPRDYGPIFQGGPMLKDGACGLPNADLVRLRDALEAYTRRHATR